LLTGVTMVYVSGLPWSLLWIHASLALYVVLAIVAIAVYTPTLRKQIAALEARGGSDPEFVRLSARGASVGAVLGVIAMAIIALMVFKPA
jgi:uncharacterized membrane protein